MSWISMVILSGIATLVPLLLIFFILLRKVKNDFSWAFLGMVVSAIAWIVTFTLSNWLAYQGHGINFLSSLSASMVLLNAMAFYMFCEFFPIRVRGTDSAFRSRLSILVLVSIFTLFFQYQSDYMTNRRVIDGVVKADRGFTFAVAGIPILLIALAGLSLLGYKYFQIRDVRSRKSIKVVFFAYLFIALLVFLFSYCLPQFGYENFTFLGPTAYVFLFILTGYLIVIHRFLDIRSSVLQFLLWAIFTFLPGIGALFLIFVANLEPGIRLALTAILFLALHFHTRFIQPRISRLFFQSQLQAEGVLKAFFLELQAIGEEGVTLGILLDNILHSLRNALAAETGLIIGIDRFRRIVVSHVGNLPDGFEKSTHFIARRNLKLTPEFTAKMNQLFLLELGGNYPFDRPSEIERKYPLIVEKIKRIATDLEKAGYRLFIPLIFRFELCGYIALGEKTSGLPYFSRELEIIETIRHSIALTLRNFVYYEELLLFRNQAQEQIFEMANLLTHKINPNTSETVIANRSTGKALVFSSPQMVDVYSLVKEMAPQKYPVLISGETGTGKELVAQLLHRESELEGPFIAVNCAAIYGSLWESEVFGHVKGAYTDAKTDKEGYVAKATGGTLFFDEIGEMPFEMQPKILRLLQEKSYRRVGDEREQTMNCRMIFATHRDLKEMCQKKTFREDLYYRISVLTIRVPPLRERIEEIPVLVEHLLPKYAAELGKNINYIEKGALDALCRYFWPGNIRELENILIQSVLACKTEGLTFHSLPVQIRESGRVMVSLPQRLDLSDKNLFRIGMFSFDQMVNDYMTRLIRNALRKTSNSSLRAAELLRMKPGKLYYQMSKLGIPRKNS